MNSIHRCACRAVFASTALLVGMLGTTAAQQHEFLFRGTTHFAYTHGTPMAVGDIDLDGHPDIVAYSYVGVVSVRVHPDGSLGPPDVLLDVPWSNRPGVIADVTGDTLPDVVVVGPPGLTLYVLPGQPSGVLGPALVSPIAAPITSVTTITVGHIDPDGHADLVLSPLFPDCKCAVVLPGDGTGFFPTALPIDLGPDSKHAAIEDVTGDGIGDLIAVVVPPSSFNSALAVAPGLAGGDFGSVVLSAVGSRVSNMVVVDLDGDTLPDVVAGSRLQAMESSVALLHNVGGGLFSPVETILLVDTDYQGPGPAPYIDVQDFDQDGLPDVRAWVPDGAPSGVRGLWSLRGLGGLAFEQPQHEVASFGMGRFHSVDVDGDGWLDVVGGDSWSLRIVHGTEGGGVEQPLRFDACLGALDVVADDVNGDSVPDLVAVCGTSARAFLGAGDGSFTAGPDTPVPEGTSRLILTDMNDDATLDLIAFAPEAAAPISIFLGAGDGSFAPNGSLDLGVIADVKLADVDGDGVLDALATQPVERAVVVALGSAGGGFDPPMSFAVVDRPAGLDVGDIDGDGLVDVCVALEEDDMFETSKLGVLRGLGRGQLGAPTTWGSWSSSRHVVVADMDGDGRLDVVVGCYGFTSIFGSEFEGSGVVLFHNAGGGALSAEFPFLGTGFLTDRTAVADVNRDGHLDIVLSPPPAPVSDNHSLLDAFGIYLIQPDGSLGFMLRVPTEPRTTASAVADFDGDGFPDLVAFSDASDQPAVFLNRSETWATLGFGTPGASVSPLLRGQGTPAPDQLVSIEVSHVPSPSLALLIVGLEATFDDGPTGLLVPSADAVFALATPGVAVSRWPPGLLPGAPVYLQALVKPFAGSDVAISNALVVLAQ
jgi:hypothetical protein